MPHPLLERVLQIAHRTRRVAVLAAVGRVAAVAFGVALVLMLADYAMRLSDPGMRWLSAGLLLAAVAAAGRRWLRGGPWRSVTPLAVAQQIERQRPTLGSRLASAVEFLQQPADDPAAGSADLRRAVVTQTAADVEQMPLEEVIDHRPLRLAGRWLSACLAAAVVFGVADPAGLSIAAVRLAAPWSDHNWPRRNHLIISDAPDRIARGQSFAAEVADKFDADLPTDLRAQFRTRVGGKVRVEELTLPALGSQASLVRENVQQAFSFRLVGGDDDRMPWRAVEVVDPPRLSALTLSAQPPAYAGLAPSKLAEEGRVLTGTAIELDAHSEEPLASAALLTLVDEETTTHALQVDTSAGGSDVSLAAPWTPTASGGPAAVTYRVRITSADGLEGQGSPRSLRVEPDTPPTLSWLEPPGEVRVTAAAVTPVRVLAEDNLAIAKAELLWRAAEEGFSEEEVVTAEPKVERIGLYAGPESPPARASLPWDAPADSRELVHEFDLAPLGLTPGDELLLLVEATDYRPGVGVTPQPRRVVVISEEEFASRLADDQSSLVQDLNRLLAEQRETRAAAGELAIDRRANPQTTPQTLDRLSALGFEQLRINQGVTDDRRGAAARSEQLLRDLKQNRQDQPELQEQLERLRDGLRRLADGPLASAGRGLADARRSAQQAAESSDREAEQQADRSLAEATEQQDQAIEALEDMVERMSGWSDFQRFGQELAELERQQRDLREQTLGQAAKAAANPLAAAENAAARAKLRAAQAEIAKRFGKLQDAMRKAIDQNRGSEQERSDAAQSLKDALAESQDNATRGKLREAQRQLASGQLGRSAEQQEQAADDLRDMLQTLRDRASSDPKQLAEQLRQAQQQLAELQQQLDKLQQNAQQPGQARDRQKLAEKTRRMGRKLDRLNAQQAGQSAQQSGQSMQQSAEQSRQGEPGEQKLADAQQQLQRAQEQLQQEIERQKQIQALKVLDRLAARLGGYIERQTSLLEDAVGAEQEQQAGADGPEFRAAVGQIAAGQQLLREDVEIARRNVAEREVFELALRGAVGQMDRAIERLEGRAVDRPTQQRQYAALERLKHVQDALKLNPPEPEDQEQQGGGQGGGQGGQPPPPSPVDVAELKMLRLMQLDVNAQTRSLEAESADQRLPAADARRQAEELSRRQQRLGELVQELIDRINERQTNPRELPDGAT